jgi:hypothetical protein
MSGLSGLWRRWKHARNALHYVDAADSQVALMRAELAEARAEVTFLREFIARGGGLGELAVWRAQVAAFEAQQAGRGRRAGVPRLLPPNVHP